MKKYLLTAAALAAVTSAPALADGDNRSTDTEISRSTRRTRPSATLKPQPTR